MSHKRDGGGGWGGGSRDHIHPTSCTAPVGRHRAKLIYFESFPRPPSYKAFITSASLPMSHTSHGHFNLFKFSPTSFSYLFCLIVLTPFSLSPSSSPFVPPPLNQRAASLPPPLIKRIAPFFSPSQLPLSKALPFFLPCYILSCLCSIRSVSVYPSPFHPSTLRFPLNALYYFLAVSSQ